MHFLFTFLLTFLPLLSLAAPLPKHGFFPSSNRHSALAKRVYGLPVHMDTLVPTVPLAARIVIPDHINEQDLVKRDAFLRGGAAGGKSAMRKKRSTSSCKVRPSATNTATESVVASATSSPLQVSSSASQKAPTATVNAAVVSSSSAAHVVSSSSSAAAAASTSPSSSSSSSSSSSTTSSTTNDDSVTYTSGWTSVSSNGQTLAVSALKHISLADAVAATKGDMPAIGTAPDGSTALTAVYKANDVGSDAGWSYYADGPTDLSSAQEVESTYSVWFADGFDFVIGGKLPGLYGGVEGVYGCSGGDQSSRNSCFSARMMWRKNGEGEIYTYLPETDANVKACEASGDGAVCNSQTYGLSFGRGNFNFKTGAWVQVKERIRLNDVGQSNGYAHLYIDGTLQISADNLTIRTKSSTVFRGMMMSTFFGGSSSDYAPSTQQKSWFKDFSIGIIA